MSRHSAGLIRVQGQIVNVREVVSLSVSRAKEEIQIVKGKLLKSFKLTIRVIETFGTLDYSFSVTKVNLVL